MVSGIVSFGKQLMCNSSRNGLLLTLGMTAHIRVVHSSQHCLRDFKPATCRNAHWCRIFKITLPIVHMWCTGRGSRVHHATKASNCSGRNICQFSSWVSDRPKSDSRGYSSGWHHQCVPAIWENAFLGAISYTQSDLAGGLVLLTTIQLRRPVAIAMTVQLFGSVQESFELQGNKSAVEMLLSWGLIRIGLDLCSRLAATSSPGNVKQCNQAVFFSKSIFLYQAWLIWPLFDGMLCAVQQLKPSCGEQLVYIAAFAAGARIVYGDRVKADTYRRLANISSLAELDHAFGVQVLQSQISSLQVYPSLHICGI